MLLDLPSDQNVLLGYQRSNCTQIRHGILDKPKIIDMIKKVFEQYDVRPKDITINASDFSGGNQQKIIVGREFYRKHKLAIVAYPIRGVDIAAADIIHRKVLELRDSGSAIILIMSDLDELLKISDTVGVIYEGKISAWGPAEEFDRLRLGHFMGGGK